MILLVWFSSNGYLRQISLSFSCITPSTPTPPTRTSFIFFGPWLGVDKIDEIVAESGTIHPTHFAVFWALEATAKRLSRESAAVAAAATAGRKGKGKRRGGRGMRMALEAEAAWSRVVAAVEETLPALHHEKVVYLDALAQANVVAGDIEV